MIDPWYSVQNASEIDSPALLVFPDRVKENITRVIRYVGDVNRLRPHIKTHKSAEVVRMLMDAGISKVKCATIAEAEMLAQEGMRDVLLAYQPVGPKARRLLDLVKQFPETKFSCLIDDAGAGQHLAEMFGADKKKIDVYIDLNIGMNRTGVAPTEAFDLYTCLRSVETIHVVGLHAYDGHLRDVDFQTRKAKCDKGFEQVTTLKSQIKNSFADNVKVIAGGTPTFSIHKDRPEVECSPGTFIYWDKGYEAILCEQKYLHAAIVLARVVSKPGKNLITVDLGHKAIASENPISNRVYFLNAPVITPVGHSEEHMVFQHTEDQSYEVGDVLYGVPYHVCPTVALYDEVHVISNHNFGSRWTTSARKRKISI